VSPEDRGDDAPLVARDEAHFWVSLEVAREPLAALVGEKPDAVALRHSLSTSS